MLKIHNLLPQAFSFFSFLVYFSCVTMADSDQIPTVEYYYTNIGIVEVSVIVSNEVNCTCSAGYAKGDCIPSDCRKAKLQRCTGTNDSNAWCEMKKTIEIDPIIVGPQL